MYKILSANASINTQALGGNWWKTLLKKAGYAISGIEVLDRSWRAYERENIEKHFGPVLDVSCDDGISALRAYEKYKDSLEYIRWFPDTDTCNSKQYKGILNQDSQIGLKYIANSAKGFLAAQSKDETFKIWQKNDVYCPNYFVFHNKTEFYEKLSESKIQLPFLIRVNNSVAGKETMIVRKKTEIDKALNKIEQANKNRIGIDRKMMCIQFINTIDKSRNVNVSYRIHVAGSKVISGYARVVSKDNWLAITAGSFKLEHVENWVYYNEICQKMMEEKEEEIVKSVEVLNLNHQGIDIVFDEDLKKLCFLEVQPTYATGYKRNGYMGYYEPFWNPSDPQLVKFLIENKSELQEKLPYYYYNWLDKNNHFNLVYKELKRYVWS